jgi:large subunit ribosomal protein L10
MKLKKEDKIQLTKELATRMKEKPTFLVTNFKGLKSKEDNELRMALVEQKMEHKAVKKRLIDKALHTANLEGADIKNTEGQLALSWGDDGIALAKSVHKFAQDHDKENLILGGFLEGKFFSKDKIIELANLPSIEMLRARLVGALQGSLTGLVNVLSGNQRKLVMTLNAIKQSKE